MTEEDTLRYRVISVEKDIEGIQEQVTLIKDNHLAHIQDDVTALKTDMTWLKKFFWVVASASIGSLLAGLINLIIQYN
jgi:hypothetical protein